MSISLISGHHDRSYVYQGAEPRDPAGPTPATDAPVATIAATISTGQAALARLLGQFATAPADTATGRAGASQPDDPVETILRSISEPDLGPQGGGVQPMPASSLSTSVKPNLDALNRVLAHYKAQSAAVNTAIGSSQT